jgi:hypothetical protein
MPATTFEETPFEKASEFLDTLRLSKPKWWDYPKLTELPDRNWVRHWYFRGQSESGWSLTPSAWREAKDKSKDFIGIARSQIIPAGIEVPLRNNWNLLGKSANGTSDEWQNTYTVVLQACAEAILIKEFLDLAADLGHRIPNSREWTNLLRPDLGSFIDHYVINHYKNADYIDDVWMHPVVALAQHHRITTRLLDWTRNPLFAAFFAAVEVADNPDPKKEIAVYAVNDLMLKNHVKLVAVPGSEIDFLRAQGGVFTYDSKGDDLYIRTGQYPSLETSIIGNTLDPANRPKKFTLPQTQASELLRLLWLEGVTQAHLMPTLDNVSVALQTKWRLIDKTRDQA